MTESRPDVQEFHFGGLRRSAVLLALVGAVIVGLLAMHTLQTMMGPHDYYMGGAVGMAAPAGGDPVAVVENPIGAMAPGESSAAPCSVMCEPEHAMLGMACVLALLFTGMILAAIRPATLAPLSAQKTPVGRLGPSATARPGPAPPDLNALSISRT